ncbi:MAG: twin transmembrane helix small protein [Pseudomonadota bacterium]
MQTFLTYGFYAALAGVFVVLVLGLLNLVRADAGQASRSNQLMRLRVVVQFVAVLLLVAIGFLSGAIDIGF